MKSGLFIFVLILIVYTGFEIYAVKKLGYRMEPDHIYAQHVGAEYAVERCGKDIAPWREKFERNTRYMRDRALGFLAEREDGDAQQRLAASEQAARTEVQTLIDARGCDDRDVWRWLKRYELLAKKRLPIPAQTAAPQTDS